MYQRFIRFKNGPTPLPKPVSVYSIGVIFNTSFGSSRPEADVKRKMKCAVSRMAREGLLLAPSRITIRAATNFFAKKEAREYEL